MIDAIAPRANLGLSVTAFAFPGPPRDESTALVRAGTKTATAGLVADDIVEDDFALTDSTPVVCQWIRLGERLGPT